MSKGITAFIIMLAPILAISMLSGIGYYDHLHVNYDNSGANSDVQAAADAMTDQEATDTGGSAIVEFTTGASDALQSFWQVISNTSGVLQLLFGLPPEIADPFQTLFQISFGITFAGFIRGVVF